MAMLTGTIAQLVEPLQVQRRLNFVVVIAVDKVGRGWKKQKPETCREL